MLGKSANWTPQIHHLLLIRFFFVANRVRESINGGMTLTYRVIIMLVPVKAVLTFINVDMTMYFHNDLKFKVNS